jgi:hypothetical protein
MYRAYDRWDLILAKNSESFRRIQFVFIWVPNQTQVVLKSLFMPDQECQNPATVTMQIGELEPGRTVQILWDVAGFSDSLENAVDRGVDWFHQR